MKCSDEILIFREVSQSKFQNKLAFLDTSFKGWNTKKIPNETNLHIIVLEL